MNLRIALALTIPLAAATGADGGALVAFRSEAVVTGGVVTLGDVADVRGSDPATGQKLSAIILGPGPDAGRQTSFPFDAIRSRLMSAGVNLAEVEFSGLSTVTVRGVATSAPPAGASPARPASAGDRERASEAIAAAVRRHVTANGGPAPVTVKVMKVDGGIAPQDIASVHGFDVDGGSAPWSGPQTFTLRFIDASERVRELRANCVLSERPSILAARHALTKGHVLRPDDLVWRSAENDVEAACATDPAQLLGCETQQSIRGGQAIPADAVRSLPLVRNGQFVTTTSRRPGLAVQRVMKAKSDGAMGEVIPLYTLEDRKTVLARVTGLQEAEVVDPSQATAARTNVPMSKADGNVLPASHVRPAESAAPVADAPRVLVNPVRPLSVPVGP